MAGLGLAEFAGEQGAHLAREVRDVGVGEAGVGDGVEHAHADRVAALQHEAALRERVARALQDDRQQGYARALGHFEGAGPERAQTPIG